MDAFEFLKEFNRMCDQYKDVMCKVCPRIKCESCDALSLNATALKELVKCVERWSKEHPQRTRLEDFKEKYPNMKCRDSGIPWACCSYLGYCESCDEAKSDCIVCWNMPVEE